MSEALKPMTKLVNALIALAPKAALVVGVVLAGLLIAYVAGRLIRWLARHSGLEAAAERAGIAKLLYAIGARRGLAHLLGRITWFCVLLFTLSAVAELLGLTGIAKAMSALVSFIPRLLAGAAVMVAGLLIGEFLRGLVRRVSDRRGDVDSPNLVAEIIYYLVLVLATVMAIDQIGFDTALINSIIRIAAAAVLLSVGLAFALGSRSIFHNFLVRQYYQPLVHVGDQIAVGEISGTVVRYSRVAVVVQTDRGEHLIPCRLLIEQPVVLNRASDKSA